MPPFLLSREEHFQEDWSEPVDKAEGAPATPAPTDTGTLTPRSLDSSFKSTTTDSIMSTAGASQAEVTAAEMSESWLQVFSQFSVTHPCKDKSINSRGESDAIAKLSPLKELSWRAVLDFVLQLKRLHSSFKDASVPWHPIIDATLEPTILVRY